MKRFVIAMVLIIAGFPADIIHTVSARLAMTRAHELTNTTAQLVRDRELSPGWHRNNSQVAQPSQSNAGVEAKCGPGQAVSGDLGYTGTECHGCTISGKHLVGEPDMEFEAEPILSGIREDGPAAGKLMEGDVLVAIDGQAITTREAAVHLSWLKPREPVQLTVRRNSVLTNVQINPAARCRTVTQPRFILIDRRSRHQ